VCCRCRHGANRQPALSALHNLLNHFVEGEAGRVDARSGAGEIRAVQGRRVAQDVIERLVRTCANVEPTPQLVRLGTQPDRGQRDIRQQAEVDAVLGIHDAADDQARGTGVARVHGHGVEVDGLEPVPHGVGRGLGCPVLRRRRAVEHAQLIDVDVRDGHAVGREPGEQLPGGGRFADPRRTVKPQHRQRARHDQRVWPPGRGPGQRVFGGWIG
jgi:hypothetical protein